MVFESSFAKPNHTNLADLCAHAANDVFVIIAAASLIHSHTVSAAAAAEAHFPYATMRTHKQFRWHITNDLRFTGVRQLCTAKCENLF